MSDGMKSKVINHKYNTANRDPSRIKVNMAEYIQMTQKNIREPLDTVIRQYPCTFVNTREVDDRLCEDLKHNEIHYDGYRRWIEVHRSIRIRVITKALIEDFGYKMWSGKTRKVLYKPDILSEPDTVTTDN